MQVGIIGLGRMGKNIALNLLDHKVKLVAYNRSPEVTKEVEAKGATPVYTLKEMCEKLPCPRTVLLMVPAGNVVDEMIQTLLPHLSKGDTIIDGGNSFFKDSVRRYEELKKHGINFLDEGTSGGLEGARTGACLTIGGDYEVYKQHEELFKTIAIKDGYLYTGPAGSGHFVKMVHNGIEYGYLQALGEGYDVLDNGPYKLDYAAIAKVWSHRSVIRSWLVELAQKAFEKDPNLEKISGVIGGGETGTWALETANEEKVPVPALEAALNARKTSQARPRFAGQVIAAVRNEFGGHAITKQV